MPGTTPNAPAGTSGLIIAPWSKGEWYGVAANWAEASATVYTYGERPGDWVPTGRQVADYQHDPRQAMRDVLARALEASGDDPDEADDLIDEAVEI